MSTEALPLLIEVVAYAPTAFYHCQHCEVVWQQTGFSRGLHEEQVRSALPHDLQADYQQLSDWVHKLRRAYPERLRFTVIDAASPQGLWKTLRHGLVRYPAVIVAGRHVGADLKRAEAEIVRQLAAV